MARLPLRCELLHCSSAVCALFHSLVVVVVVVDVECMGENIMNL